MRRPATRTGTSPVGIASWEGSDSLSAWDGDRCVGNVAGFRFDTLVPGGAWLPTSGVTRVGVLSTHRRRGLMRALLTRLLTEAADRGQVLASLRASETRIYQRFGFGLAGRSAEATMTPRDALPITGVGDRRDDAAAPSRRDPPDGRRRLRPRRPTSGVLKRPEWMWQRYLEKAIELGGDAEFVAVHTSADGVDDGWVHYSVKWVEARSTPPRGAGEVYDLWGVTPAVELALWDYLCNVDLVDEWYAEERPVDDVIQFAVADTRAYRTKWLFDEQWLRLLDVDAALDGAALRRRRRLRDDRCRGHAAAAQHGRVECVGVRRQASRRRGRPRPRSSTSVSCRRPTSAARRGARSPPPVGSTCATRRRCRSPTPCSPSPRRRTAAAASSHGARCQA